MRENADNVILSPNDIIKLINKEGHERGVFPPYFGERNEEMLYNALKNQKRYKCPKIVWECMEEKTGWMLKNWLGLDLSTCDILINHILNNIGRNGPNQ